MAIAFPFSAIVGQDEMKLALTIAAVDPKVGGVLAFGDRGSGKSTAVRGLAVLLPQMKAIIGCRYQCDPDDDVCIAAIAARAARKPSSSRSSCPCRWSICRLARRRTAWSARSIWSAR